MAIDRFSKDRRRAGDNRKLQLVRRALMGAAVAVVIASPVMPMGGGSAHAAESRVAIAIPGGALDNGLIALSSQTGIVIVTDPALVSGRSTAGVRGNMTPEHAVEALLSGSGLTFRRNPDGGYVVVRAGLRKVSMLQDSPRRSESPAPASVGPQETIDNSTDIVVTARRRNERLQDVPISISAVGGRQLERANITSVLDLARAIPSVTASPQLGGSRSTPSFAIRGLSQQELSILNDQSVSVYIGDIVAARQQGLNGALFDVDTVEVLKGPQGTLFGRNTTGGAIVIRPRQPTDNFEGSVGLTYGRFDTSQVDAMINLPVTSTLSLRLAGKLENSDGYIFDEILGRNVDFVDNEAFRATLLFKPAPGISSRTTYNFYHENGGGNGSFIKYINPNGALNTPAARALRGYRPLEELLAEQQARGIYRISNGSQIFAKVRTHDIANTTSIALSDHVTAKNIIGYRRVRSYTFDDLDGTSNSLHPVERSDKVNQFSNEFQIIGDHSRLDWIVGAFYFSEKGRNIYENPTGAIDAGLIEPTETANFPTPAATTYTVTDTTGRNRSYAFFAQATYQIVDGLSITAGGRWNNDKRGARIRNRFKAGCRFTRDLDNNPATAETAVGLDLCDLKLSKSFSEPTYNISLDYKIAPDKLVYIAHRHGYRTGGFGARSATEAGLRRTFRPETVDDIEIGTKAEWRIASGGLLRTNIAAYRANYKDIQRLLIDTATIPPATVAVNAGKARIQGVELDILLRPVPNLEFTASYAYTDAKYLRFIFPDGSNHTADKFARAPKNVYTLGARYEFPIDRQLGKLSVGGSYYHTDSYSGNEGFSRNFSRVNAYSLVNADVSWERAFGSAVDISIFGTNLAGRKYSTLFLNVEGLGYVSHIPGEPRTYGISARIHFGN